MGFSSLHILCHRKRADGGQAGNGGCLQTINGGSATLAGCGGRESAQHAQPQQPRPQPHPQLQQRKRPTCPASAAPAPAASSTAGGKQAPQPIGAGGASGAASLGTCRPPPAPRRDRRNAQHAQTAAQDESVEQQFAAALARLCLGAPHRTSASSAHTLSAHVAAERVKSGDLVQGCLRVNARKTDEAFVSVEGYARDVAVVRPPPSSFPPSLPPSPVCADLDPRTEVRNEARAGVTGLNCAGYGSSICVTAPFGFVAAGLIIKALLA